MTYQVTPHVAQEHPVVHAVVANALAWHFLKVVVIGPMRFTASMLGSKVSCWA